ncbi:hypothetical protein GCM10011609_71550 [Lentzea pudingi]|uniref:Uncharacterized protein n=2 Tax=Lentzea pudingi TaxID=1789439 RepID=A0ABQ2IMA8_9PSEU|nr:hypothetical protein GCM10011609_71550 [Lentzea pudingi]
MPRNRYTREVRDGELIALEVQSEQIERLSAAFKTEAKNPSVIPPINPVKQIRNRRRAHARRHKPARYRNAGTQSF